MEMQGEKRKLLDAITADLKSIEGVKAIVLGGSYATGFATEISDLDIGIYYSKQNPFDIENIKGATTSEFGGLQLFHSYSQPSALTGVSLPAVSFPQIPSTGSSMPPNWQLPTQRPFNFLIVTYSIISL